MNVRTEQTGKISIVRVGEARLMYPILSDFSSAVTTLLAAGNHDILIDLAPATYIHTATTGCLMDFYRQAHNVGGHLQPSGAPKPVPTELSSTGARTITANHPHR